MIHKDSLMDTKQTSQRTDNNWTLSEDSDYYTYVFKKTEKIVCAVFYTLRSSKDITVNDSIVKDAEQAAQRLLDSAYATLSASYLYQSTRLSEQSFALLILQSRLRVLEAGRLLRPELCTVFVNEIDGVLRLLKRYRQAEAANPLLQSEPAPVLPLRREPRYGARSARERVSPTAVGNGSGGVAVAPRRARILTVIKDKGEVTIKDIADIVTDVSEKTIQRELIDLIKDGVIVRKGERRWSRYSAAAL